MNLVLLTEPVPDLLFLLIPDDLFFLIFFCLNLPLWQKKVNNNDIWIINKYGIPLLNCSAVFCVNIKYDNTR